MKTPVEPGSPGGLTLGAKTAADLMTPNPLSLRADATAREAAAFLTTKGFSAAPVIDETGRPVGVLSRADLVVHEAEKTDLPGSTAEYFEKLDLTARPGRFPTTEPGAVADRARVRDLMTPAVFAVAPEASAYKVVEQLLALNVHRLFVVGADGVLVGVISTTDVLRHLRPEPQAPPAS